MKIACQSCGAKYTIADDKVRGRRVKIRCKGCATPIVVDGQNANADGEIQGVADTGSDTINPEPMPEWSVNLSETDSRTMTPEEIVAGWKSGLVTSDAFVWKEGMADWIPILECAELKPLLGPAPAAATATPAPVIGSAKPPAAQARMAGGRGQATHDLFGISEHDIAMGPSAGAQEKPTGARNENSVLFSLDALKAGFSNEKPAAPPPRERTNVTSNPDDPFGMGASGGFGFSGGGLQFGDNQALLTAPAPPEPAPAPMPMPSVDLGALAAPQPSSGANKLAQLKQNKKLMIGAAGGAFLLIVGIAFAFSGGKKEETPKPETSALAAQEAEQKKAEEAKKEEEAKKAEEAKKEEEAKKAEEAKKQEEAKKAEEGKKEEEKKEESKVASTAPGKPGASKPPATKAEPPPPAGGAAPFSTGAARTALTSAASSASSCKKPGGPTGSGKVQVTFAPSGRVTSATVMGPPFAGTAVGGCVAAVFRRASVPAFSGSPVTVAKGFMIN